MFAKMFALDAEAFRVFIDTPKALLYSRLAILIIGIVYGAIAILYNASYILSFESSILRLVIVPLFFLLFGLLMVLITKFGLTVLLWAGARGFGGPGRMKQLNQFASVALAPGLLGVPYLIGGGEGILIVPLLIGVGWMYLICVKILEVTQRFQGVKAYISVLAIIIFFASIYYIIIPTGPIS
jgi:hypothetical protein